MASQSSEHCESELCEAGSGRSLGDNRPGLRTQFPDNLDSQEHAPGAGWGMSSPPPQVARNWSTSGPTEFGKFWPKLAEVDGYWVNIRRVRPEIFADPGPNSAVSGACWFDRTYSSSAPNRRKPARSLSIRVLARPIDAGRYCPTRVEVGTTAGSGPHSAKLDPGSTEFGRFRLDWPDLGKHRPTFRDFASFRKDGFPLQRP